MLGVLAVRFLHRLPQGVEGRRSIGIAPRDRSTRRTTDTAISVSGDVRVRDAGGGFRLTKNRRRNGAENVVVVSRGFVTRIHILRIDSDSYVARRHHHDRCRALHFSVQVACRTQLAVAEGSIFALKASVDEVRHRCRPTAHRARVGAVVAGLEEGGDNLPLEHLIRLDWRAVELGEIIGELRRLPAAVFLRGSGVGEPRDAVGHVGVPRKSGVRFVTACRVIGDSLLRNEIKARRSLRPRFCKNLNHTGGRLGPVQRRGRGALQDLDPLDRIGIDVVQPRRRAAAARSDVVTEAAATVDAYTVDVHDRLVRL